MHNKSKNNILETCGIDTGYQGKNILSNVNIKLESGEMLFIIGQNGSGKSTFVKTVCGELVPSKGSIYYNNTEILRIKVNELNSIGISYFPQGGLIIPELTVKEHFQLISKNANKDFRKTVYKEFPRLQILENKLAGNLSGGERQMLSLGIMIIQNNNFWILDEPTAGLAPKFVDFTIDFLRRKNEEGISMLIVEHNMEVAFQLAHNITIAKDHTLSQKFEREIFIQKHFLENFVYN